ncbi:hypothetical protein OF83DRAFT_194775 [Amylostereum chailletii]|nr:hypothetical protein OF83DRAFT_194775 [Amylostereum chailletii]
MAFGCYPMSRRVLQAVAPRPRITSLLSRPSRPFSAVLLDHNVVGDSSPPPAPTPSTSSLTSSPPPSFADKLIALKTRELLDHVVQNGQDPERTWDLYVDLVDYVGLTPLPAEVHQLVLRNCLASPSEMRIRHKQAYRTMYYPDAPHIYEDRLQSIMRNLRGSGYTPSVQDYNVVLRQFAAVGHFLGARTVLNEMDQTGVTPESSTFGFCLQAIAHRFTLPSPDASTHARMERSAEKMARQLMMRLWELKKPLLVPNLDLAIRVLGQVADSEGFDRLIKFAYGIDLAFPDQVPLEDLQETVAVDNPDESEVHTTTFRPLTTHALNMIIETLGRMGRISKMVQTFEVLTNPLPPRPSNPTTSFDEDEDESFYAPSAPALIYASPNTYTYCRLVFHSSAAGHGTLARHFVVDAMNWQRSDNRRLRYQVIKRAPQDIDAPRISITREMLLPIFHHANKHKNIKLIDFVKLATGRAIARKKQDIEFLNVWRSILYERAAAKALENRETQEDKITHDSNPPFPSLPITFFTPSSIRPVFPPPRADPPKHFQVDQHLDLLTREIQGLEHLLRTVTETRSRTLQRIKERLGRRVWGEKNVYMADDDARVSIDKTRWRDVVGFHTPQANTRNTTPHFTASIQRR